MTFCYLNSRVIDSLTGAAHLSDRHQRVNVGDSFSGWRLVNMGIPQGSVFGHLMFNIFFNNLFLIRLDCKLSAYADDT